jgi:hypothetical protein
MYWFDTVIRRAVFTAYAGEQLKNKPVQWRPQFFTEML